MLYILNSPILTGYGVYQWIGSDLAIAKIVLSHYQEKGEVQSAVGHEATAKLMSELFDAQIPMNRQTIEMKPGDKAIVFRLLERLPEGKVLDEKELKSVKYEIGVMIHTYLTDEAKALLN